MTVTATLTPAPIKSKQIFSWDEIHSVPGFYRPMWPADRYCRYVCMESKLFFGITQSGDILVPNDGGQSICFVHDDATLNIEISN